MTLADELRHRRLKLGAVRYNDAKARFGALWDWLDSDPASHRILDRLRAIAPRLIASADPRTPPPAGTDEEVAAVGAYLLDRWRGERGLWDLAFDLGISPPYSTTSLQNLSDEPIRRFILPALEFVEATLRHTGITRSSDALATERFAVLDSQPFWALFPATADASKRIASALAAAPPDIHWQDFGNSVRSMLLTLATELRPRLRAEDQEALKAGDFKATIQSYLSATGSAGRFRDSLVSLLAAIWDHAQSVTHRPASTRADAERCYLIATVAIAEIYFVISDTPDRPMLTDTSPPSGPKP